MGLKGADGPPKKKLKQAQLNFCLTSEKTNKKRKLSDSTEGLAVKVSRRDSPNPKTPLFNKENVNAHKTPSDDVLLKTPDNTDVVLVEDDLTDSEEKSACTASLTDEIADREPKIEKVGNDDDVTRQDSPKRQSGSVKQDECSTDPPKNGRLEVEPINEKNATEEIEVPNKSPEVLSGQKSDFVEAGGLSAESTSDDVAVADEKTPTKSTRNFKNDVQTDNSDPDSKHNQSVDSEQCDVNSSVVLSSEDEQDVQVTPTTPGRKSHGTPRSLAKKAERQRLREEKQRLSKEKKEKKRKEKEEKEKKKQEELRLKEEEKKRKDDEKKRKEEVKEEERKRREEEKRKKEEEKKKKEELKEEERKKKEEARLAEERKKNLATAAFTKFFIQEKSKAKEESETQVEKIERYQFMPFPIKSDMRLAVQTRRTLSDQAKEVLSNALTTTQSINNLYLKELKSGRKPGTSPATWPLSDEQHDVIIVESIDEDKVNDVQEATSNWKCKGIKGRAKLLQFHENRRPPYWGTWRKPSKAVGPRRPFGQDNILDYEVDSESEWEDDEEGEDIEKEDGDSDKEEADDDNVGENGYVLDNTFVPHGYLSDEEAAEGDEEDDSVEDQKMKLSVLKLEFDQEIKSKTQKLQPRLLGCVYISNKTLEVSKSLYEPLMKLRCRWNPSEEPIDVLSPPVVECQSPSTSTNKFPSSLVEKLVKLVHGNRCSLKALISEFMCSCEKENQLSSITKRAVFLKVKEIAAKTYSASSGRLVWAVKPELCAEYGLEPIIDPAKGVPSPSPVVEPPKPKDSPMVNFLKKTPQPPVRRVSTTLIPRDEPRAAQAPHVDTPRPIVPPRDNLLASLSRIPGKPVRRVATTLISSTSVPVTNKMFNVGEIDAPFAKAVNSSTSTAATDVALVQSGEVYPLSQSTDPIKASTIKIDSTLTEERKPTPVESAKVAAELPYEVARASSAAADPALPESHPPDSQSKAGLTQEAGDTVVPTTMETDNSARAPQDPVATTEPTFPKPLPPSPAAASGSSSQPSSKTGTPQGTDSPRPPCPKKRVPLITLSKKVTAKNKSPGQKGTIADMFCRKSATELGETNRKPLEISASIDLSGDSN